jgi:hypothetical protein
MTPELADALDRLDATARQVRGDIEQHENAHSRRRLTMELAEAVPGLTARIRELERLVKELEF